MTEPEESSEPSAPTIDAIQRDVALANQYRLELIKLIMTLSGAILAFTVSFRPSLQHVDLSWLMWSGWISLAFSMVGGMIHMFGWDRYYVSYRDFDWKGETEAGKRKRKSINLWRRAGMFMQFTLFGVGVVAIALFAATNFGNVAVPPVPPASAAPR